MCGGKAPAPPPAPDPVVTAQAQADANTRTAQQQFDLNQQTARATATRDRINQVTPFGELTYTQDPNNQDRWTATQSLSPDMQARLRMVYDTISNPVDLNAIGATTNSAADALMGRLQPTLGTQRTQLETRLRSQGLTPGSDAWVNAMRDFSQSENDARLATLGQADQFANNALSRAITARQAPLNEFTQLTGQNNFINAPSAATANTNLAPTDYLGAVQLNQSAQNAAYQARMQAYQSNLAGMYGLGSALLGGAGRMLGGGQKPWIFGT